MAGPAGSVSGLPGPPAPRIPPDLLLRRVLGKGLRMRVVSKGAAGPGERYLWEMLPLDECVHG